MSAGLESVREVAPCALSRPSLFTPDFITLLVVNVAFSFAFSSFFLLPKFMAQELSASASEIGAVSAAFGVTMVASIPLVGRLLDGSRNRQVMIGGCALMALSSAGFLGVDALGVSIILLRSVQGLALSLFNNAGAVVVAKLAPPGRLAQALGIFAGTGMIMTAIAPALGEVVAASAGYAPVFLSAAIAAALAVVLALRVRSTPAAVIVPSSLRSMLRRKSSLRMIAVLGSAGLGFGVMFAFSTPFALELGMVNVRGFFLAFAAGAALVRFGLGGMIDRVGHRRVSTYALAAYGAVVMAMYALTPGRLALLGGVFGLSHGLFIPAFTAFMVGNSKEHERGKLMTLFNGAFNIGNCNVLVLGVLAEKFGYRALFAGTGALIAVTPLLLVRWPDGSVEHE